MDGVAEASPLPPGIPYQSGTLGREDNSAGAELCLDGWNDLGLRLQAKLLEAVNVQGLSLTFGDRSKHIVSLDK